MGKIKAFVILGLCFCAVVSYGADKTTGVSIDKSKTALVVIDLQKGVAGMTAAPYTAAAVIKNAEALADKFRKDNMSVFLVHVNMSMDGRDKLNPNADIQWPAGNLPADWADIVPEMGPKLNDIVITKRQWGAFYGTELDLELRRRGITTIVLCGIATNIGVESTARDAYEYGYSQVFAEDAMSAGSAEEHVFPVTKTFPRLGLVRKTADILAGL